MIEYDEGAGTFRVFVDKRIDGKRVKKSKTLPVGCTLEQAQKFEQLLLDEDFPLKDSLRTVIESGPAKRGNVYALKHEYMPGVIKIGVTSSNVQGRISNLSTSMPVDFQLVHSVYLEHSVSVEQFLHVYFRTQRINPNREFFRLSEKEIIDALDIAFSIDGVDLGAILSKCFN